MCPVCAAGGDPAGGARNQYPCGYGKEKRMGKTLFAILACLALVVGFGTSALAYEDLVNVYTYSVGGTINWSHTYDGSENPISWATLTIVADDVDGPNPDYPGDDGENDAVWFNGNYLGTLTQMGSYTNFNYYPGPGNPNQPLTATTFSLDPAWITPNMPVSVVVESLWGVEIETSKLTVCGQPAIPELPAPVLASLCGLGGLAVQRLRRRVR